MPFQVDGFVIENFRISMTHSSRKRSRACEDDEGCDFMPISKRINNLHIRSRSALLNSDDEGQEENGVEQSTTDSSCSCHERDFGFLVENNGTFHDARLPASGVALVTNGHPSAPLNVPAIYQNGHHPQVFNGEVPHSLHGASHTGSEQLTRLGPPLANWDMNGMFQEVNSYEPDLDENENPYYYHANEMLYHLHMARLQRINRLHGHPHMG